MIGEKVFLRPVEFKDVDILQSIENNTDLWHLSNTLTPFSRFAIEQYIIEASTRDIYNLKQLRLMIAEIQTKQVVGTIDLFDFNPTHKRAGVGILIIPEHRNKTYASQALSLLIQYAFNTLQLHQLYCTITPDNTASLQLFKKHGFIQSGTHKSWHLINNQWHDELFFQLINQKA